MMSEVAEPDMEPAPAKPTAKILAVVLILLLGAGGFASTYLGLIDPAAMLNKPKTEETEQTPGFVFVDVPQVVLTIAGARPKTLVMSLKIEADLNQVKNVEYLLPRILDSVNVFISDVDPKAFEKRGILEIIRSELATRLSYILGPDSFRDILITEFRIQ